MAVNQSFVQDSSGTLGLPTGASTSALQISGNTSLTSIATTSNSTATNTATVAANQTNGTQRTLVADQVGNLQPTGDAPVRSIYTRVSDGTNSVAILGSAALRVINATNGGGSQGALTVGTTAQLASSNGTSNLTNRINLTVYNNSLVPVYWGYTNAVTTSTGTPIQPGQERSWDATSGTNIYLIAGTAGNNIRITEAAI